LYHLATVEIGKSLQFNSYVNQIIMKQQRTFWMDGNDWKKLQSKIALEGFSGKGKFERFMEKVSRENIIFIKGTGIFKITME